MIAPLVVWRRGEDDFLLLTEPELGDVGARPADAACGSPRAARSSSRSTPRRSSSATRDGIPTRDYGVPAVEVLDAVDDAAPPDEELERLRILARTPRWGREIDEGILPAEAGPRRARGLVHEGLLPGPGAARPAARTAATSNRTLRVLELDGDAPAAGERGDATRAAPSAASRARCPASRSPTCASRCPTAPSSRSRAAGRGYTDRRPRARSSGDRALPCGGRGRKFESCRAHP